MNARHAVTRWACAAALAAAIGLPAAAPAELVLVRDGEARSIIILPREPNRYEKEAAEQLALHIRQISGAEIPIVTGSNGCNGTGKVRLLIGAAATQAIPGLNVERALGARVDEMSSRDGFVTRARDGTIALVGVRPPGTAYAAFDLLERLGCRWFFPGELGTIVPRRRTISIKPFESIQTPSFDLRNMWVCGFGGDGLNKDSIEDIAKWGRRNRQSYDYQWSASHNMSDTTGESLAKPEQVDIVVKRVVSELDENPRKSWYTLGWDDTYCRVTAEQAMGIMHPWYPIPQATDPLIRFYNAVVEKVEKKHPGKKYGFLAYMNYLPAPVMTSPHPSLVPVVAPIEQCPRHVPLDGTCWQRDALLKSIQGWCSLSNRVLIYDYEPGFLIDGGVPVPCVTRMRREYPLWHEAGVRGLYGQVQMSIMNNGPNLYVRQRLAWDINADVDRLMTEYFTMLFGPAAKHARKWWDALEHMMHHGRGHQHEDEIMKVVYPIDKVRRLERHVRAAERRADTERFRQRVRMIRFSHDNLMLYLRMRKAEDEARFADAAELAERIWTLREQVEAYNPYFYKIGDLDRTSEEASFLSRGWATHNAARAALVDGTAGTLVAMTDDVWSFRTDPHDVGVARSWYELDAAPRGWRTIRTSQIWETQGLEDKVGRGYDGAGWYLTHVDVPNRYAGRKILLSFAGVYGRMLIWVNGKLVHHRPWTGPWWRNAYHEIEDVDVTEVLMTAKRNTLVIRVDNEGEWGGIYRRVFLYTPSSAEPSSNGDTSARH